MNWVASAQRMNLSIQSKLHRRFRYHRLGGCQMYQQKRNPQCWFSSHTVSHQCVVQNYGSCCALQSIRICEQTNEMCTYKHHLCVPSGSETNMRPRFSVFDIEIAFNISQKRSRYLHWSQTGNETVAFPLLVIRAKWNWVKICTEKNITTATERQGILILSQIAKLKNLLTNKIAAFPVYLCFADSNQVSTS